MLLCVFITDTLYIFGCVWRLLCGLDCVTGTEIMEVHKSKCFLVKSRAGMSCVCVDKFIISCSVCLCLQRSKRNTYGIGSSRFEMVDIHGF